MSTVAKLLGGGPSGSDITAAGQNLHDPNAANYQIAGVPQYQAGLAANSAQAQSIAANGAGNYNAGAANAGLANQAAATNLIGQTAAGNGPSLARANLQQGLSQQANQIQSQAMSNQGNTAGGLSQRNMLNAQAAAGNSMVQNAGTASVAEQLGAQSNYASAANAQTQGQMSNSLNASNAGLAQNQQGLSAAQLGSSNLQAGQAQNDQQAQNNMGLDAAQSNYGQAKTNIALQAAGADASQLGAVGKFGGEVAMAAASDEDTKQDIRQGSATDSQIGKFLKGFMENSKQAKKDQQAKGAPQPENPNSSFTPAMLTTGAGVLAGGGAKFNYNSGLNSALSSMPQNKLGAQAGADPTAMPAGTTPHEMGMVQGSSLGPPPGAAPSYYSDERLKENVVKNKNSNVDMKKYLERGPFDNQYPPPSPGEIKFESQQRVMDNQMIHPNDPRYENIHKGGSFEHSVVDPAMRNREDPVSRLFPPPTEEEKFHGSTMGDWDYIFNPQVEFHDGYDRPDTQDRWGNKMFSRERQAQRLQHNPGRMDPTLDSWMGQMKPSTFEYKDQSYSPGSHMGVMAQDVEKSKLGAGMVQETPQGKAINVPKAMGASLAGLAYLNERVDTVMKKLGLGGKNAG